MNPLTSKSEHYQQVRKRAEHLLETLEYKTGDPGPETCESAAMVQDLMVSHIELELQQDEIFRTREQLEAAVAEASLFFDLAPFPYMQIDRNGIIHRCNLAGCELLGVPRNRFSPGKLPVALIIASEGQVAVHAALRDAFDQSRVAKCRTRVADGGEALFTVSAPVRAGRGEALALAALVLLA